MLEIVQVMGLMLADKPEERDDAYRVIRELDALIREKGEEWVNEPIARPRRDFELLV